VVCLRCHQPGPGYDYLADRRFDSFLGFLVFPVYSTRRVDCRRCEAVVVEEVPWADGNRTLTRAYMLFLARWARKLSRKETAEAFRTSWEKVFDAVEYIVTFGLEHRPRPNRCHRSGRNSACQRAQISDAGLSDRPRCHTFALGRQGKNRRIVPGVLRDDRRRDRFEDCLRLFRHVEAVSLAFCTAAS
jgi:hypothetical protein